MVAAAEEVEQAGSDRYHDSHMGAIFKEGFSFSGYERDLLALNLGGEEFLNISGVSGVDSISDGRGSLFADFDNDGDLDIFMTTVQGEAHYLFRNNVGQDGGFLRIDLEGTKSGRDAYGAVVRVKSSAGLQAKLKSGGSGYISQSDSRLLFGIGSDAAAESVEVVWPSGATQTLESIPAGSSIRVVEGTPGYTTVSESRLTLVDPMEGEEAKLARVGFRVGEKFPALTVRSPAGKSLPLDSLSGGAGRKLLVNLWATWCVPCAREMPELERLYPDLKRGGVDLVGLSVDFGGTTPQAR